MGNKFKVSLEIGVRTNRQKMNLKFTAPTASKAYTEAQAMAKDLSVKIQRTVKVLSVVEI